MKKSLIALAALATVATAAQAQSSVTVYGIVDSGLVRVTGANASDQTVTAVQSGALSTSRLGFKGTEDLGGGLKANFLLEQEILADDGTNASPTFKRGSWVQLDQAGIGSVTAGYQNRLDYSATASMDPFGASNVGGFVSAGYLGSRSTLTTRVIDAVTLQSAKFNGLSVAYQRQFGGVAGDNKYDSSNIYNADYTAGALRANVTSTKSYNASGAQDEKSTLSYLSYDLGFAQPVLGHISSQAGSTAAKIKTTMLGVKVPVNAKNTLVFGYYDVENKTAANKDSTAYSFNYLYALSKRTTLYVSYARSSLDASSEAAIANIAEHKTTAGHAAGVNSSVTATGIRHAF